MERLSDMNKKKELIHVKAQEQHAPLGLVYFAAECPICGFKCRQMFWEWSIDKFPIGCAIDLASNRYKHGNDSMNKRCKHLVNCVHPPGATSGFDIEFNFREPEPEAIPLGRRRCSGLGM